MSIIRKYSLIINDDIILFIFNKLINFTGKLADLYKSLLFNLAMKSSVLMLFTRSSFFNISLYL
jgi:hypothetical protein